MGMGLFSLEERFDNDDLLRVFIHKNFIRTRGDRAIDFGGMFLRIYILHDNNVMCQSVEQEFIQAVSQQTESNSAYIFVHRIGDCSPDSYSAAGTQFSEMTTVGLESGLTVRSANGSVVAPDYMYPVSINCAGGCFDAISVCITFKLIDYIILHDLILRDDSASNLPRLVLISMQDIKLHELSYESVGGVQYDATAEISRLSAKQNRSRTV
jgi:hypothetical protein